MKYLVIILVLALMAFTSKSDNSNAAYKLFDKNGKEVTFSEAGEVLCKSKVIFFGELHDNPIAHWLQLRLVKIAYDLKKEKLVLGAEMLESDGQLLLNEYLSGKINEKSFEEEMRLWPNYKTDYKPLVEFAKANALAFIATNIPRRYANLVYKNGFEALYDLSDDAKCFIVPLPIEYDANLACYKKMLEMAGGHGGDNLPKAQAIKDATMAWFISQNLKDDEQFIHFNGSWHSDNMQGICWYLKRYYEKINIASITTVSQDQVDNLEKENKGLADFILVVPSDMTSTH